MTALAWVLLGVACVALLVAVDRLMTWMESRGWVYWRRRSPTGGGVGAAAFEVAALFQPTQHVLVEEQAKQEAGEADENAEGDPDDEASVST